MSDAETSTTGPSPDQQSLTDRQPESQPEQQEPKKPSPTSISFSIWPPSQRTRDAVVTRLIETLSTPSVLSKRYGTLPQEEASDAARRIEEEAFGVASAAVSTEEDGLEILQLYSKEISKRMLDIVKARAASDSSVANGVAGTPSGAVEASNEEVSSSISTEA